MTIGQIVLAIVIVILSIVTPIYYQYLDKKDSKKKEAKKIELKKKDNYNENINQKKKQVKLINY